MNIDVKVSIRLLEKRDEAEANSNIYRLIFLHTALDILCQKLVQKRFIIIWIICGILGYIDLGLLSEACLCCITPICMFYVLMIYVITPLEYSKYHGTGRNIYTFWSQPGRKFWVAEVDGHLVGTIAVDTVSPTTAEVFRLSVKKRYRGLGIANKLIDTLLKYTESHGFDHVVLVTSAVQVAAQKFYEKKEFKVVNTEEHGPFPRYYFGYRAFLYHLSLKGSPPGYWAMPK